MDRATTSRRALLRAASTALAYTAGAGIVTAGMAIATDAKSQTLDPTPAAEQADFHYTRGYQEAQIDAATAWLARWTGRGGAVMPALDNDSDCIFWQREYYDTPQHTADLARFGGTIADEHLTALTHQHDGAVRELRAMLKEQPELLANVKRIVRAVGGVASREA